MSRGVLGQAVDLVSGSHQHAGELARPRRGDRFIGANWDLWPVCAPTRDGPLSGRRLVAAVERSHAERHPKEPRMVAVVTLTDVAGARYAITLSTADLISLREVLGILFSADQNTVAQGWTELIAGQ